MAYGISYPSNRGWRSRSLRSRSSSRRERRTGAIFSTGSTPSARSAPWAARPGIVIRKLSAPAWGDGQLGGLEDDRRVADVAALDRRQRAGAAVLLADHAVDHHGAGRLHAGVAQRADRVAGAAQPPLHVRGAAAVDLLVLHRRPPRRDRPPVGLAGGDDVDVAVEDQGRPVAAADAPHHAERPVALDLGAEGGVARERVQVDLPDVGLQAGLLQQRGDPLLDLRLAAAVALEGDQLVQRPDQAVEVDGVEDAGLPVSQGGSSCRAPAFPARPPPRSGRLTHARAPPAPAPGRPPGRRRSRSRPSSGPASRGSPPQRAPPRSTRRGW